MMAEILQDADTRMDKSVKAFKAELAKIRTGRAHPSLLDHITVDYYGTPTPLTQAASIAVEDAQTLAITAWDKSLVRVIERAIMESDLGLNPATAGAVIRVPLPALTQERRRELVKVVRGESEQARIAVRNIRRDALGDFKDLLKEKEISEDEERRAHERVQKMTDLHVKQIDELTVAKEQDMLEI